MCIWDQAGRLGTVEWDRSESLGLLSKVVPMAKFLISVVKS